MPPDTPETDFVAAGHTLSARLSMEGILIAANNTWLETFGRPDRPAWPYVALVHPQDKAYSLDYLSCVRNKPFSVVFANRCCAKNGEYHKILWQVDALTQPRCLRLTGIDTSTYEAEAHIEPYLNAEQNFFNNATLLAALFKVSPLGISLSDRHGRLVRVNPALCTLFGWDEHELLGQEIVNLFAPQHHTDLYTRYRHHGEHRLDNEINEANIVNGVRKDGTYFALELLTRTLDQYDKLLVMSLVKESNSHNPPLAQAHEHSENLRLVIENLPIMVDALDENGHIVLWNHECEKISGYSAAEIENNPNALAMLYPDPAYREKMQHAVAAVSLENPSYRRGEWTLTCKDGSHKTIAWSVNGQIKIPGFAVWGIGEDVSARNQALAQLRGSEERLRLIVESLPIMVDAVDENGNFVLWNRECERVMGFSAHDILHNPHALELLYPEASYRAQVRTAIRNSLRKNNHHHSDDSIRHGEWEMACKDGSRKIIAWAVNTQIQIPGFAMLAIGSDVTERNQALNRLKSNEHRLRLLVENMPVMLAAYDAEGRLVMWNRHCEEVTGHPAQKMLANPDAIYALYPQPEELREWKMWLNSKSFVEWDARVLCQNGSYKMIQWSNMSGPLPIPGWTHWVIGRDLSALSKRQQNLSENQSLLDAALDNIGHAVAITDNRLYFVYVNRAYCNLFGYGQDDLLDHPLAKIMAEGSSSFVYRHYFSFYTGAHGDVHEESDYTGIHHHGHSISGQLTARRISLPKEEHPPQIYVLWIIETPKTPKT
jgi:PAS domain S-box-containing protein